MSKPTAFPLDESRLPFEIPRDEPYREKIARLGQMIADRIPAKKGILTKDDPEYWGLASIVTDEMADVALKMKVRKPMTLPELVKATGKPAGELEPLLQQMAVVGLSLAEKVRRQVCRRSVQLPYVPRRHGRGLRRRPRRLVHRRGRYGRLPRRDQQGALRDLR